MKYPTKAPCHANVMRSIQPQCMEHAIETHGRKTKKALQSLLGVATACSVIAAAVSAHAVSVDGLNLSCGNLHGYFCVSSSWFNGEGHNYSNPTDFTSAANVAPMLNFLKGEVDVMTTKSNSFGGQSHGWYDTFVRFGETAGGNDCSGGWNANGLQSQAQFNGSITNVIAPFVSYCASHGLYVVLCSSAAGVNDGNGAHNMSQGYLNNLKTWWQAVASAPGIKNADNVIFEICNEPIQIESVMGNGDWGSGQAKYWQALQTFENQVVTTIRNTGATNVILGTSLGYESENQGWVSYPLSGSNIGYAAHFYPGYITPHDDPNQVLSKWNTAYQPAANIAPLVITECMWTPNDGTGYQDLWNASTAGFGTALKTCIDNAGNVSWVVGMPSDLVTNINDGLSGLTLNGSDGAQASFQWWADYSSSGTGVTFYQDFNYAGSAGQTLTPGSYTLSQLAAHNVPNDWTSSAKIPIGWTVTMYADDNFGGTSWTLTSDTPNFSSLSPSANDQMSSCVISRGVTFYQDYSYGGTVGQPLPKGSYTLSQLAAHGVSNDWASSARIPAGWTVIMYANDNFSGTSWTLTSDTPNFGSLSPSANDQISSCKIQ